MRTGLSRLIAATVIGGVAAYVITWLVPRSTGFSAYAVFAVFWGFLFLLVSALSGVQQEITRSTRPRLDDSPHSLTSARFGAAAAGTVFLLILATSPLWVDRVFGDYGHALVWPLATGAGCYVLIAVIGGTLYGLREWNALFWLIITEGLLRVAAVATVLLVSDDLVLLAWAVALPFPATPILLFRLLFVRLRGRSELDVTARHLIWNASRTVVASTAMGSLISGLPLLVGLTSAHDLPATVGLVIVTMTFTRAPLTVVLMSFQSYLIVAFQTAQHRARLLLLIAAATVGAGVVLAILGYLLGPPVFQFLFPREQSPSGWLVAAMVVTSVAIGLLCITSPALLATSRHSGYTSGWVVAALVTTALLLVPAPIEQRVVAALVVGPLVGLVVHALFLVVGYRRQRVPNAASIG